MTIKLLIILLIVIAMGGCSVRTFPETVQDVDNTNNGIPIVEVKF